MSLSNFRVLIISSYEICYNPRLIKAANFYSSRGCEVTIFNPKIGISDENLYSEVKNDERFKLIEFDISKKSIISKVLWFFSGLISRTSFFFWKHLNSTLGFSYILNKGLIGFPKQIQDFDLVHINLVDNLPYAASIKNKFNSVLIYDSQEFFTGMKFNSSAIKDWVNIAEKKYLKDVDLIITTTNVMKEKFKQKYTTIQPIIRVRNAPYKYNNYFSDIDDCNSNFLNLAWHGFSINYTGRGVDLIINALEHTNKNIFMTLQGRINNSQRDLINEVTEKKNLSQRITIKEPVYPDHIVKSLLNYDVGVIAEPGVDENQFLTSSNKLFDYVHAGLAIIAPKLPGLEETITKYRVGLLYEVGNYREMAECIEELYKNRKLLNELSSNSMKAAKEITWEEDFQHVWNSINKIL